MLHLLTSGKSTQKALTFNPYRKLAKHSLKRARLSCISCICMKLASRSAMLSDSSAKAGSKDEIGVDAAEYEPCVGVREERSELRDGGRRGVVGSGGGVLVRVSD